MLPYSRLPRVKDAPQSDLVIVSNVRSYRKTRVRVMREALLFCEIRMFEENLCNVRYFIDNEDRL